MTATKRPTRLMEPTPSMQWADHIEASRRSKLGVAIGAVVVLLIVFVVVMVSALNGAFA